MCNVMSETSRTDDEIAYRSRDLETMTTLSANEAEVLARKEVGQTHREIGASMGIEKGTVDSHKSISMRLTCRRNPMSGMKRMNRG